MAHAESNRAMLPIVAVMATSSTGLTFEAGCRVPGQARIGCTVMAEWWQSGVIYQIYPRSFRDSDGDGVGDLAGVSQRLDYLAGILGVDAIWLSPFYPSPMRDFGYDVADYCDVDPLFGDLDDFDRLLAAAHERGLRVIVDLVPNHTSDEHPWFRASRSSRDDPKREWYVWAEAGPDGSPPNNWLAVFGGPAWEWDEPTGQYYLHSFLPSQPDLNWRNPEVEAAIHDVMRFWLDRGVDGFRIDVAAFLMKDPQLRDNPVLEAPADTGFKRLAEYDRQAHVHDKGHPDIHGVFRRMRRLVDGYQPPRMTVGEIHDFDFRRWATYYGRGDELHMPFNFSLLYADWMAAEFRVLVDGMEEALPGGAWPNYVLGNHDEPRLATRYGSAHARVAAMMLLTLRGTPTLYYGDELGLPEAEIAPAEARDPWGLRVPGLGRDGCRTPMPWNREPGAGFTEPGVRPWLPLGPGAADRSVEAQLEDHRSLLNLYRRLLEVRRRHAALQTGAYVPIDDVPEGCFAYRRESGIGRALMVALNFTDRPMAVPGLCPGRLLLSTELDREGAVESVELRADEGIILEAE